MNAFGIRTVSAGEVTRTFHGVKFSRLLLAHEEDLSNITPAKEFDLLEAGRTDFNLVGK